MNPTLLLTIASHLWQSTLFALFAAGLTRLLRKNQARIRYSIWLAASLKFLVPFSLLMALGGRFSWRTTPAVERQPLAIFVQGIGQPFEGLTQSVVTSSRPSFPFLAALLILWAAGSLTLTLIWAFRWRRVAQTVRRAVAVAAGREIETLRRIEASGGIATPIELRLSGGSLEPGVFGILRPLLILPAGIGCHLSKAQLESVIAHEISHIRRYDNLTAALHMVVEILFWFHPLVWWLGSRLVDERERACDEEVLKVVGQPQEYAEGILRVCELYLQSPVLAVSGVTGSDLKKRVESIMAQRRIASLNAARKTVLTLAGIAVVVGPFAFGVWTAPPAQAQSQLRSLSFEVASVRLHKSGEAPRQNLYRPGGLFTATDATLKSLVLNAYNISSERLSGGPGWLDSDGFDIEAKAQADMFPARQLGREDTEKLDLMLQGLLADRFRLQIRREPREMPIYALVVAKGGSKLKPAFKDRNCSAVAAGPAGLCHMFSGGARAGITAQSVDMNDLADVLSNWGLTDRPVFNQTGLQGVFDFYLKWTPDGLRSPNAQQAISQRSENIAVDFNGPSLAEAIQQQLGLKLESQKGAVDFYVIETAEKPSEN